MWFNLLFTFTLTFTLTFSSRILGMVSSTAYSHQVAFLQIWKALSIEGHQLVALTTNPLKDLSLTNLTEIDCSYSYKTINDLLNLNEMINTSTMEFMEKVTFVGYKLVEGQLQHPMVQELLKNETNHFDVMINEGLYPGMVAFSEKYRCPLIQAMTTDALHYQYHNMGNPINPVVSPESMLPFVGRLNFPQRLISVVFSLLMEYYKSRTFYYQNSLIRKYFGETHPSLDETLSKTSLFFVYTNKIFHVPKPLLPSIIPFGGGTHFGASKALPKNLQTLLDNATNGFIYFSLGTNVKSEQLTEERYKTIIETFEELPYTILWKYEQEDLPYKPANVIVSKWLPQQDIFRHPNVRLFITQGGLQSAEEALYNHVPIIGLPFYGDQQFNVGKIVYEGMGLSLDFLTMDKKAFKEAILEVIDNLKYRNRVEELVKIAKDQPMTSLESVIWWTEYVIRHNGTKHFKSPAVDLPFYQYSLLDAVVCCITITVLGLFISIRLSRL